MCIYTIYYACAAALTGIGVGCNHSNLLEYTALRVQLTLCPFDQWMQRAQVPTLCLRDCGRSLRSQLISISHQQEVKSRQVEVFVCFDIFGVDLCQCWPLQLGQWGGRSEGLSCLK